VIKIYIFSKLNITPTSKITRLRAGSPIERLNHVLSFRRQMYIVAKNLNKLRDSILINYDNTNHRIFYSADDSVVCFICKTSGLISSNCPKKPAETSKESQDEFPQKPISNTTDTCTTTQQHIT